MLEAAGDLGARGNVRVKRTFLGLHALPPEFKDDRAAYVQLVADVMIPAVAAAAWPMLSMRSVRILASPRKRWITCSRPRARTASM
jgi:imidazolonepropionase-like amidohydrolase